MDKRWGFTLRIIVLAAIAGQGSEQGSSKAPLQPVKQDTESHRQPAQAEGKIPGAPAKEWPNRLYQDWFLPS